ncbi:MAG: F0F1 ATP synthase subunit A, partial [Candidatus Solibacter usitatus]|nr:F0F1 ATP synthase subunit A [Candidatus Solibacter usitatus]
MFNDHLAGFANSVLALVGVHAHNPLRPWTTPMAMQILVMVIIVVLFAVLRARLSMDRPGKLQHVFEVIYGFLHDTAEEQVGHHGRHYLALFGTIFIFILFANLLGVVPTFESPTM